VPQDSSPVRVSSLKRQKLRRSYTAAQARRARAMVAPAGVLSITHGIAATLPVVAITSVTTAIQTVHIVLFASTLPVTDRFICFEECAMISLRQRLRCLPGLCAGVAAGLLLALITRLSSGVEPAVFALLAALPFLLAALTGVAKTTTA
jgi:hypothetical protein